VINLYGILISVSILVCILVVKYLRDNDRDGDFVWGLAPWAIISGLIGARVYHIISSFGYYVNHPINVFYIWNGGLGIWGAVAGGLIGTILYLRKNGKTVWPWLDACAVSLPLGQSIGRWGNYFNREIYGSQTSFPWGIYINGKKYHPLFLYESLLDLLNFSILFFLYKKTNLKNNSGFLTFLYLLNYSIIRFFMELIRQDGQKLLGLNVSLLIPILLFMAALFCLLRINRRDV
jgi:phosphatidylglycerol:prolipoprotein diacylglycerol transferase